MVWEMTAEELLARYKAGERNFAGVDLNPRCDNEWIGLSRADLRGINLRGANLYYVNFGKSDLSGADCFGAYLGHAGLGCANFQGANLRGAILKYSYWGNTNLSGADLTDANLTGAVLIEANLTGAILEGAYLVDTKLKGIVVDGKSEERTVDTTNALFWHTTMPDGRVELGPTYDLYIG